MLWNVIKSFSAVESDISWVIHKSTILHKNLYWHLPTMHLYSSRWFYEQIIDRTAIAPSFSIYTLGAKSLKSLWKYGISKLIKSGNEQDVRVFWNIYMEWETALNNLVWERAVQIIQNDSLIQKKLIQLNWTRFRFETDSCLV